jgi:hypothetical protein
VADVTYSPTTTKAAVATEEGIDGDVAVVTGRGSFSGQPSAAPNGDPAKRPPSPNFVFRISDEEAESLLRIFREHMGPFNVFVEIPASMTAATLRAQRPMLFLGIVFAASFHDFELQKSMARSIMTYISEQMFQQGRRSLQLLQGVTTFLHWYITSFPSAAHSLLQLTARRYSSQLFVNPQVTNLLHITMALTTDLGLDKLEPSTGKSPLTPYVENALHGPTFLSEDHTMEERRALLSSFYLTSLISSNVNMFTSLGYSHQVDDTCKLFEKGDIGSADFRLAKLVRLQYIISRIYQTTKESDFSSGYGFPIAYRIQFFNDSLERFWETLPADLRTDGTYQRWRMAILANPLQ